MITLSPMAPPRFTLTDETVNNCRENGGIGVDEFEGYKIVDTPTNVDYWSPLFETDEELEAADC